MKILVLSQYHGMEIFDRQFVPRVGDKVDVFYEPMPTVNTVVAWPSRTKLRQLGIDDKIQIEALVTVE
jgi:hypothetical protein